MKRISPPKFNSQRSREFRIIKPDTSFDESELSEDYYKLILQQIKSRGLTNKKGIEFFVNRLFPNQSRLYDIFLRFHENYIKNKRYEERKIKGQALMDKLNDEKDNMEDAKNFGLQISKRKKKKGDKEELTEQQQRIYKRLDEIVDNVCLWIYLCVSPKRICIELCKNDSKYFFDLNPIIYNHWADWTEHKEKLVYAWKKSAEEHMFASQEFLLEWLDKEKHPELNMQHVGIVREVALWKSRMAGFLDRKKFGAKVEITDDQKQVRVLTGSDLNKFLEGITKAAKKINAEDVKEDEIEDMDEDGEFDFGSGEGNEKFDQSEEVK